jgi:hypothetical protein
MDHFDLTLLSALVATFCLAYLPTSRAPSNTPRPALSERDRYGLRHLVKRCIEETISSMGTTSHGEGSREVTLRRETVYDLDGHLLARLVHNSDDSVWATRYIHDAAGRLLKVSSGREGDPPMVSVYTYDEQERLTSIDDGVNPPITFSYEGGRKTKRQVSREQDYKPNVAVAADSPFQAADLPPNLEGGGSAVTSYDESDRPIEVQVANTQVDTVSRAIRAYDAEGRVAEDKQILEDPLAILPVSTRAKIAESSGSDLEQVRKQIRALMGDHQGFSSVRFIYDAQGRVEKRLRQIFNREDEIEITYNEQGDEASTKTRTIRTWGTPEQTTPTSDSDVRYSYQYDAHGNWTERITAVSSGLDGIFSPTSKTRRTLTYF